MRGTLARCNIHLLEGPCGTPGPCGGAAVQWVVISGKSVRVRCDLHKVDPSLRHQGRPCVFSSPEDAVVALVLLT